MNNQNQKNNELLREKISERAYHFWEAAGRPDGRDSEFWLQAESEMGATSHPGQSSESKPAQPDASPPSQTKPAPQKTGLGRTRSAPETSAPVKTSEPARISNPIPSAPFNKPSVPNRRA